MGGRAEGYIPSSPPTCTSGNGPRLKKMNILSLCPPQGNSEKRMYGKMNKWSAETFMLLAGGGGEGGAKICCVHIWNFYCCEPPIFRGTEPGFFFLNFCHKKSAHYFSLSEVCHYSFSQQQTVLHCKYDQFHSTLWTVLISSSCIVDQQEVVKKSSNNSRSVVCNILKGQ